MLNNSTININTINTNYLLIYLYINKDACPLAPLSFLPSTKRTCHYSVHAWSLQCSVFSPCLHISLCRDETAWDRHDCLTVTHDCCTCESCLYVFSDIMYAFHCDDCSLSSSSLRPLPSADAHVALLLSDGEAGLVMQTLMTLCSFVFETLYVWELIALLLPFQDALAIPSLSITPLSMSWHSCPHDCQHNAIDTGMLSIPVSLMIYDWFLVWRCVLLMSSSGGTAILNVLKYPFCFLQLHEYATLDELHILLESFSLYCATLCTTLLTRPPELQRSVWAWGRTPPIARGRGNASSGERSFDPRRPFVGRHPFIANLHTCLITISQWFTPTWFQMHFSILSHAISLSGVSLLFASTATPFPVLDMSPVGYLRSTRLSNLIKHPFSRFLVRLDELTLSLQSLLLTLCILYNKHSICI